jgi:hypothetical protein
LLDDSLSRSIPKFSGVVAVGVLAVGSSVTVVDLSVYGVKLAFEFASWLKRGERRSPHTAVGGLDRRGIKEGK